MTELRRRPLERITGVVWGLIVTAAAVTAMYALSGTEVDMTNVAIVALLALGGTLVISALVASRPRRSQPDAVVTEESEPAQASGLESL